MADSTNREDWEPWLRRLRDLHAQSQTMGGEERLAKHRSTGKLDVRAAAAALPDEAPDDGEPLAPDDDAADDDVDATDAPEEG